MEERYTDILLHIRRSGAGAASYRVAADLDDGSGFTGEAFCFEAGSLLLAEADPQAYGRLLFDALFQGPIRDAYHKALSIAEQQSAGRLRVRLWIDEEAGELHALPWERLYHLLHGQLIPLATSTLTPFSRYTRLPIAEPAPLAARPVRLLAAFANPRALPGGLAPIQVEQEILTLREALGDLRAGGQVDVTLLPGVTGVNPELRARLEAEGYRIAAGESSLTSIARLLPDHHILHFWGHGAFRRGESGGQALLFLEKADGSWEGVADDAIVQQLAPLNPLPQLIFLAACESAKRDAGASNPFVGLAPKLVRAGVPVVVAMQALVPMPVARQLTGDFYRKLFDHGVADRAMNEARGLLFKASSSDWAIPVLFSRLRGNHLFAAPDGDAAPVERAWFEPETVWVPAGRFRMGSDAGEGVPAGESPQHEVTLPAFHIGTFPVTNREYAEFLKRVPKQEVPRKAGWFLREPPADKLDHPVVGVSWHDALAYCRWLSEATGRRYRLPSEAEWERAARGTDGRRFPWGDAWDAAACQVGASTTAPVGAHPTGASPSGCLDLAGNVQEWVQSAWGSDLATSGFPYPYDARDGREETESGVAYRVHRGGSFQQGEKEARCAARDRSRAESATPSRGFRVVRER